MLASLGWETVALKRHGRLNGDKMSAGKGMGEGEGYIYLLCSRPSRVYSNSGVRDDEVG